MKTYDEVLKEFMWDGTASEEERINQSLHSYDGITREVGQNPRTQILLAALYERSNGIADMGLFMAFVAGITIGIEMEKGDFEVKGATK